MTDIKVPTLGESVTEATVGQWLKAAGDQIAKDDILVELETDKVSVEVPAPEAGTLTAIVANEGDTVEIGAVLATLNGGAAAPAPASNGAAAPAAPDPAPVAAAQPAPATGGSTADVVVPDMGESVAEGSMGQLLKAAGDPVAKDETIAEIETDKVALEVSASADGVISEWLVSEGDSVTPGAVIARIASSGAAAASAPAATTSAAAQT
ncbi:MAG: biotin/lipoyl-containing protein, partial [Pseudomonadota bacterium]